jgi:hypothetical protein
MYLHKSRICKFSYISEHVQMRRSFTNLTDKGHYAHAPLRVFMAIYYHCQHLKSRSLQHLNVY